VVFVGGLKAGLIQRDILRERYVLLVFLSPGEAVFTIPLATLEATVASAMAFRTDRGDGIGLSWLGLTAIVIRHE
jgi:hypothetical protein